MVRERRRSSRNRDRNRDFDGRNDEELISSNSDNNIKPPLSTDNNDLSSIMGNDSDETMGFRKLLIKKISEKKKAKMSPDFDSFPRYITVLVVIIIFGSFSAFLGNYIFVNASKYGIPSFKPLPEVKQVEKKPIEDEKKDAPIISDYSEDNQNVGNDNNNTAANVDNGKIPGVPEEFRVMDSLPKLLRTNLMEPSDFLRFLQNPRNKVDFCKFVEQINLAYIYVFNESHDFSSSQNPPPKNSKLNYAPCINPSYWTDQDLFALYTNLYKVYIDSEINPDNFSKDEISRINIVKNYGLASYFNVIEDFPDFLKSPSRIDENTFIELMSKDQVNQIRFCLYSERFAKAYDAFVTKRKGSLKSVTNCFSDTVNKREAYIQYVFYYNYVKPDSQEPLASVLHRSYVKNYD